MKLFLLDENSYHEYYKTLVLKAKVREMFRAFNFLLISFFVLFIKTAMINENCNDMESQNGTVCKPIHLHYCADR